MVIRWSYNWEPLKTGKKELNQLYIIDLLGIMLFFCIFGHEKIQTTQRLRLWRARHPLKQIERPWRPVVKVK
jgi:hypothetical protein